MSEKETPIHIPCINCGYDTFSIELSEPCPECGHLRNPTFEEKRIHKTSIDELTRLQKLCTHWIRLFSIVLLIPVCGIGASIFFSVVSNPSDSSTKSIEFRGGILNFILYTYLLVLLILGQRISGHFRRNFENISWISSTMSVTAFIAAILILASIFVGDYQTTVTDPFEYLVTPAWVYYLFYATHLSFWLYICVLHWLIIARIHKRIPRPRGGPLAVVAGFGFLGLASTVLIPPGLDREVTFVGLVGTISEHIAVSCFVVGYLFSLFSVWLLRSELKKIITDNTPNDSTMFTRRE